MPNATLVHAACFAIGAAVGGGTVAAIGLSRKRTVPPQASASTSAVLVPAQPPSPMLQIGANGMPDLARSAGQFPGTVLKYGNPGPVSDLLVRKAYVAAYDRRMRHPAWTAEHLTLSSLGRSVIEAASEEKGDRSRSTFTEDVEVPLAFRARLQDYFRSGYDRGHMVPAADAKFSQAAMDETFLLTNIAPQVGVDFNRHYWAYVEDWCRRLTGSFQDVFIFTIPLYLPRQEADGKWRVTHEVIGSPPNIGVPTHFAKVLLTSRPSSPSTPDIPEISTGAFVLPNAAISDDTPFESFSIPIEAVERAAGLTLFSDAIKASSKHICKTTKCEVLARRFDDAQKQPCLWNRTRPGTTNCDDRRPTTTMATMDGQHPLSLKVMRVSRPSLAPQWQPFFSSSPSFSQHATQNALSLQGAEPLQGHPKTLRDLTHSGQMLTLPAAFGAIQLGETFACVLSVNNEAGIPVDAVHAKIEMQTISSKATLVEVEAPVGGAAKTLAAGDSLETVVSHEIKELGQHVLACTVTYRTPPGMRPATSGGGNADDPFVQTFRKFYKFNVTNPLSVKTKVHVPRSPTALLSRTERDKIFLEVHIQNLTQGPLWFEKIRLEAVDGWDVVDINDFTNGPEANSNKKSNMALMYAQDMRQYIYIMTPKVSSSNSSVPVPPAPGTIIPLGRLDILWRSAMGEPDRLLTSVLSRRIPLPAPSPSAIAPVSALPPYLQKSVLPGSPRSRSPSIQQHQQQQQRVSPGAAALPIPSLLGQPPPRADIEVDLVLLESPLDAAVKMEKPFSLRFSLAASAVLLHNSAILLGQTSSRKARILSLAVQHTVPAPPAPSPAPTLVSALGPSSARTLQKRTSTAMSFDTIGSTPGTHSPPSRAGSLDLLTPRRVLSPPPGLAGGQRPGTPGGENFVASPSSPAARSVGGVGMTGLEERLRRVALSEALGLYEENGRGTETFEDKDSTGWNGVRLPPPYSTSSILSRSGGYSDMASSKGTGRVSFIGVSAMFLPPYTFEAVPSGHTSIIRSAS
ncbi:hypothetical protein EW145_g5244 [Phellinidium pouzarii]|uniref:Endonuclease n=1 Tax=Phellinidium pouzarii TaxID=167371 RepID=A0A4S4L212_9AGAM|nr:hypothetical protein EW145_g5244 [Phellinidium pouzarii]